MINHSVSKTEFIKMFQLLKDVSEQEKEINNSIKKINANEFYSEKGREEAINGIRKDLKVYAKSKADEVTKSLDEILKAEQENANIFNINDTELQGAVTMLTATGGKLSPDTIKSMLKPFRGNKQALTLLKSVFDNMGMNKGYISEIDIDVNTSIDNLKRAVRSLGTSDQNISQIVRLHKEALKIADNLGIEFSDEEKDININITDFIADSARTGAGL